MKIIDKLSAKQNDPNGAPPVTLAFLGDSVTQGCFEVYRNGEDGIQTEFCVADGYHTKLRNLLELFYPRAPINMIHAGISGGKAFQGLERVERDVCAYHPDLTVVSFGLNDCGKGMDKIDEYVSSLSAIFDKLAACGSEIIFLTPNLMADYASYEVNDYLHDLYAQIIEKGKGTFDPYIDAARKLCKEKNVPVCDNTAFWHKLKDSGVDVTRLLANRINHPRPEMNELTAVMLLQQMYG